MPKKHVPTIKETDDDVCDHNAQPYANNECSTCDKDRQARYRRRRRLGMALLHAAEGRGLSGGEAIAVLKFADYATLQDCQDAWRSSGEFTDVAHAEW